MGWMYVLDRLGRRSGGKRKGKGRARYACCRTTIPRYVNSIVASLTSGGGLFTRALLEDGMEQDGMRWTGPFDSTSYIGL